MFVCLYTLVCVCVYFELWSPEDDIECLPQLPILYDKSLLTEPGIYLMARLAGQQAQGNSASSAPGLQNVPQQQASASPL